MSLTLMYLCPLANQSFEPYLNFQHRFVLWINRKVCTKIKLNLLFLLVHTIIFTLVTTYKAQIGCVDEKETQAC